MKCKVEVPEEVMEMALSQMDKFPGKTPEQVAVELIRIGLDERAAEIRSQINCILNRNTTNTLYLQHALSYIAALERAMNKKEANNG